MSAARTHIEPAWFGMSGALSYAHLRREFHPDELQALDAPEYVATGSLRSGHDMGDGMVYVATTVTAWDRIRWSAQ